MVTNYGWIDCEFNGFGGDLISMAIVTKNHGHFYEVLNLKNDDKYEEWVEQNVVPVLNKDPISEGLFKEKLSDFINQFDHLHLVADWPDDIKYFCESLIVSPGISIHTPILTMEINRSLSSEGSEIPHNALEDAKCLQRLTWSGL